MAMECKDGVYLKIKKAPVQGGGECSPDERLEHSGCATVVSYGTIAILADGRIRVTTGDAAVDILLDSGKGFKIQAKEDIFLHPGDGRKVKVYGDIEVYGEIKTRSRDEIPEKEDPLSGESE